MNMDKEDYVEISKHEDGSHSMELPIEEDGTLLLSTIHMYYPKAVSMKYKSPKGNWRGVKFAHGMFFPPRGGWGTNVYIVSTPEENGRFLFK